MQHCYVTPCLVGYLTDRFQRTTLLQMFAFTFVLTATLPLYPHCGYLAVFFVMNLVMGFANSALNSGNSTVVLVPPIQKNF